jgi:deoxyribose-phosphate aldolase
MNKKEIITSIDHSILKPTTTREDALSELKYALKAGVASVCIMPCYLNDANKIYQIFIQPIIKGCDTVVYKIDVPVLSTVIGFPHGNVSLSDKIHEIKRASKLNVVEYDAVINYSHVLSGRWNAVAKEIKAMHEACREYSGVLKVIFETCYLNERQKINLCEICSEVMEIGYVKTSTGFGSGGATIEDVTLMRKHTSEHLGVKASGGIKTLRQLQDLKKAGATRIGTSATKSIIEEYIDEPPF